MSYKDKNLVTGKKYYYKIKGYKKVGKTTYKGSKSKASKAYPKPGQSENNINKVNRKKVQNFIGKRWLVPVDMLSTEVKVKQENIQK